MIHSELQMTKKEKQQLDCLLTNLVGLPGLFYTKIIINGKFFKGRWQGKKESPYFRQKQL